VLQIAAGIVLAVAVLFLVAVLVEVLWR